MKQENAEQQSQPDNSWPISFGRLNSASYQLKSIACAILILLVVILIFLTAVTIGRLTYDLLGNDQQRATDAIKSFLPLAAAAVGLPLIIWRLTILNKQTRISEAQAQIDRETHYTSIFSKSVEQLGQTKEVKESRYREGTLEILTRTVANIEVRLGAIHSLTRLAEESARDVQKIISMLLSYVRENSWSDREGVTNKSPLKQTLHTFGWAYDFRKDAVTDRTREQLSKYTNECDQIIQREMKWAKALVDTRVDVNEAVDAAQAIKISSDKAEYILRMPYCWEIL